MFFFLRNDESGGRSYSTITAKGFQFLLLDNASQVTLASIIKILVYAREYESCFEIY